MPLYQNDHTTLVFDPEAALNKEATAIIHIVKPSGTIIREYAKIVGDMAHWESSYHLDEPGKYVAQIIVYSGNSSYEGDLIDFEVLPNVPMEIVNNSAESICPEMAALENELKKIISE